MRLASPSAGGAWSWWRGAIPYREQPVPSVPLLSGMKGQSLRNSEDSQG